MATVYLAEDVKHERKVALKVLKREMAVPSTFRSGIRKIRRQPAAQPRKLQLGPPNHGAHLADIRVAKGPV